MPLAAAYSASKAGLIALTKSVGKEVAGEGIFVNCITPAAAETAMAQLISPERRAEIMRRIPMGRSVELDEIARLLVFYGGGVRSFGWTGDLLNKRRGQAFAAARIVSRTSGAEKLPD